jgi:hypothetical protein
MPFHPFKVEPSKMALAVGSSARISAGNKAATNVISGNFM